MLSNEIGSVIRWFGGEGRRGWSDKEVISSNPPTNVTYKLLIFAYSKGKNPSRS